MKTFDELPAHSRIWIYQSGRTFSREETRKIMEKGAAFIDAWSSHGSMMDAAINIFHGLFVVIAVDERTAPASGCGIDKSVHFIKTLSEELGIDLLDRTKVAVKENGNIKVLTLSDLRGIPAGTIMFDNLIRNKSELESAWEVPVGESWAKRFI